MAAKVDISYAASLEPAEDRYDGGPAGNARMDSA